MLRLSKHEGGRRPLAGPAAHANIPGSAAASEHGRTRHGG
jgi:hypothetical protein